MNNEKETKVYDYHQEAIKNVQDKTKDVKVIKDHRELHR